MQWLIQYFGQIPSSHRSLILVGGIMFFWMLEGTWPLFRYPYKKWRHAGVNFFFTLTTILVNFPLAFVLVKSSSWAADHQFGLFARISSWPVWLQALSGLLLMDLIAAWAAHWIQHQVKFLWGFHIIHHADQHVDTTTANRHHPGESLIRFVFTALAILVTGAPMWLVFMYQSLSVVLSQFNHANIVLPRWADAAVSLVFVTPNMHHIHHHYMQPYTDSNYGNIFSIWDRLFGTYRQLDQHEIIYGIDTHPEPEENSKVSSLLQIPFRKYKIPSGQRMTARPNTLLKPKGN